MNRTIWTTLSCLSLVGCQTSIEDSATLVGSAVIKDQSGEEVGRARIYSLNDELTVNVTVEGLSEGQRGAHLHAVGDCSATNFTSAGGHLNPDDKSHGSRNQQGAHLGDLPNIGVSAERIGTMSARLEGDAEARLSQIFDDDGTSLVLHQGPDDYRSTPAGEAGSRIACGVLASSAAR